jgi:cell division protein FtsB
LLDLYRMQREKEKCLAAIEQLKEKNRVLAAEIRRLRGDRHYLESVARKELGLVKENEVIYRIRNDRKETSGTHETPQDERR